MQNQQLKGSKPANLIKFNLLQDAIKAGYIPCKLCRPPTKKDIFSTMRR